LAKYLWFLLPVIPAAASFRYLGADASVFLFWWLGLTVLGLAFLPLSARLFKGIPDSGWTFAKPLALASVSLTMWIMSSIRILPFRQWSLVLLVVVAAGLLYVPKKGYALALTAFSTQQRIRSIAVQETVFGAGLLLWTYVRGLRPAIDGLEKFMDYGFMTSMMRTDWLPAKDMWLSGSTINYYYYGQYVYTLVTKLTGTSPAIAYNLALASTFAFTLALSFALIYTALTKARERNPSISPAAPSIGAVIGSLLVTIGGNSHAFFYVDEYPGNAILAWLGKLGVLVGNIKGFWFANSTRFIGYNPETNAAGELLHDKTIHEFPYYSFLVADLHAHVIDLMFVFLFLGLLVMLASHTKARDAARLFSSVQQQAPADQTDKGWFKRESKASVALLRNTFGNPLYLIPAFLLGIFMMTNFWDFAIYFVVASMALLFINVRGYGATLTMESVPVFLLQGLLLIVPFIFVSNPILAILCFAVVLVVNTALTVLVGDALTVTGAQMSGLFLIAHIVALPFNLSFEPISKSIQLALNHTALFQLIMLWGAHFLLGLVFVLYCIWSRRKSKTTVSGAEESDALYARTRFARFLSSFDPTDLFVCGLFVCAVGLVLAPEIIYVVDIYSGDYKRANTMFKFTYQAFVLFSLVIGYGIARIPGMRSESRKENRWAGVAVAMVILLIVPLAYPLKATGQWLGSFDLKNYKGLDGLAPFGTKDSGQVEGYNAKELAPDLAAVNWFNATVKGQPTILEAYGDSYTDYCRISAYTGLPTVIGWQTHEWLWRTSKTTPNGYAGVVVPRQTDVRAIYEFTDPTAAKDLVRKYDISYIVVGDLERAKFDKIYEAALQKLGPKVFESGTLYVIQIDESWMESSSIPIPTSAPTLSPVPTQTPAPTATPAA
jgi:YYY domain-containing protein